MPLKKLTLKPGVNRENTRYTTEGGWYDSDKIRFRQGTPEKIGGWKRISDKTFLGVCRSLWNWVTLGGLNLVGLGTNLKFYIERGGAYFDATPLRGSSDNSISLSNPFATTTGSAVITVTDTAHGVVTGDIVTFTGATDVGGIPASFINTNHTVTFVTVDSYTIEVPAEATSTVAAGGGTGVAATYTHLTQNLMNPFTATLGSNVITVAHTNHGCVTGDFVTLSASSGLGGNVSSAVLSGEFQVVFLTANSYSITVGATANASDVSGSPGGGAVTAQYQINVGPEFQIPLVGWGAGSWGSGSWGTSASSSSGLRLWSQHNFGEDLVYGPRGGSIYLWDASSGVGSRGIDIRYLWGASDVPTVQNFTFVSDVSRFVFAFGCNDIGSSIQDPMLIRWSDQESVVDWTPSATTQAGSLRLSNGSEIVTVLQSRQELIVFTDSAIYAMQYVGVPAVWGAQLMGDNISIIGQNAAAMATGAVYWMGTDKFYKYDGRVNTLRCDLRQHIFGDINLGQDQQVFAGTNEGFNEIWWFYCSANSTTVDRYVVYNYLEDVWYYGTMNRTAWHDSALRDKPLAATYTHNLVAHEDGVDDGELAEIRPINAYITSAEFDIDDGHHFGFIWRLLPDITFRGSTAENPSVTMSLLPLTNSGSGYNNPASVGGSDNAGVARSAIVPVEQFTGQVYIRVRGRQMAIKVESNTLGTAWQLGSPRIDLRQDGRR